MAGKRILVTGGSGMLGTALIDTLSASHDCLATSKGSHGRSRCHWRSLDLRDKDAVARLVEEELPDVIIHAAAMTSVDACEQQPADAHALHVGATRELAAYCVRRNGHLIYISTDSVFDGSKVGPYTERDAARPLNRYASTKLEGEAAALAGGQGLVLRTNIFGWRPWRHDSFGEWVLGALRTGTPLAMFSDVWFTPIATPLLAQVIQLCVDNKVLGLYHAGGSEAVSKCEFAKRVAIAYGLSDRSIQPISVVDKHLLAPRPRNMVLDSSRLASVIGKPLPNLTDSLLIWRETEPVWKG